MALRRSYKLVEKRRRWFDWGLGTVFGLVTLFFGVIFAGLVGYGLQNAGLDWWRNPEFRFALGFTLQTTVVATLGATVLGLVCGYWLARHDFPGKVLLETLLDLPIILPPLVSGIALLILFGPVWGGTLRRLGWEVVFTERGVILAQWFIALPLALKTFKQAFAEVDLRYENIARTLGCTPAGRFFRVALPMARRGIVNGIAMAWARTVGEFGATAMLAGVTRFKTETMAAAIFLNMSIGELRMAVAVSVVLFGLAMLVLVLFRLGTVKPEDE